MKPLAYLIVLLLTSAAFAEDGKVFVKSEPLGAIISLKAGDEKALGKTPGVIVVPQGKQVLLLKLAGYKDAELEVDVKGTAILKPDAVVLEKLALQMDIIFPEEGWRVFVDKKSVNDTAGKLAISPCTVMLTLGAHDISLAKDGFADITQKADVKEIGAIEINAKPAKGVSLLLKADDKSGPVAAKVGDKTPAAKPGEQPGAEPKIKLVFSRCEYGSNDKRVDLTSTMQEIFDKDQYAVLDAKGFADPAPGRPKFMTAVFQFNGQTFNEKLREGESVVIPKIFRDGALMPTASKEFKVVAARWGAGKIWQDVTAQLDIKDTVTPFSFGHMGDPLNGTHKTLAVWFDFQGRRYCSFCYDTAPGQMMTLLPKK